MVVQKTSFQTSVYSPSLNLDLAMAHRWSITNNRQNILSPKNQVSFCSMHPELPN